MKIVLPDKQEVEVHDKNGTYSAVVDGEKTTFVENEIFPATAQDFIQQQLLLMKQIWHFSQTFKIHSDLGVFSSKKFVVTEKKALESTTDWCFFFEDYLAICRKNQQIPYAFLQRSLRQPAKKGTPIVLDDDNWWAEVKDVNQEFVNVVYKKSDLFYENKKINYSLDMGLMHLFLQNGMFQESFIVNSMAIDTFINTKPKYDYEPLNRILHYQAKDGSTQKIVSFLTNYYDFIIRRKMTFTWQRHRVFQCQKCIPFDEFLHDERNPKDPVQFLHFQLLHAVHMFEYVMNELKEYKLVGWIDNYRDVCFQLLKRFNQKSTTYKMWNPIDAVKMLEKNDCTVHGYSLDEDYLNEIWHNETLRLAWFSNFQHLIQAYISILDGSLVAQDFVAEGNIAIVNNIFVASFHLDPIRMQATVLEEERVFIRKKAHVFTRDKSVTIVSFIYPNVDMFAQFNAKLLK